MKQILYMFIIIVNFAYLCAMEPSVKKQKLEMPPKLEIELKFSIPDDQAYSNFFNWIKKKSDNFLTVEQQECYLVGPNTECRDNGKGFIDAINTLRLRSEGDADFITMKHRDIDPETNKTIQREEIETYVEDARVLKDIFTKLGYKTYEFRKVRSKTNLWFRLKNFEVAFDVMTDGRLANRIFIEVELKSPVATVTEGNKFIKNLLKSAGVKKIIMYDRGYFQMLLNPEYNFGEEINLQDLQDPDYEIETK